MSPTKHFNRESGVKKLDMVMGYEDLLDCALCENEYESEACLTCKEFDGSLEELTAKLELGRSDPHE